MNPSTLLGMAGDPNQVMRLRDQMYADLATRHGLSIEDISQEIREYEDQLRIAAQRYHQKLTFIGQAFENTLEKLATEKKPEV